MLASVTHLGVLFLGAFPENGGAPFSFPLRPSNMGKQLQDRHGVSMTLKKWANDSKIFGNDPFFFKGHGDSRYAFQASFFWRGDVSGKLEI